MLEKHGAALAAALMLTCAAAWGKPADIAAAPEPAVWVPKVFTFTYPGLTTRRACDALRTRMKNFLLELGARPDLQVQTLGCTQPVAADVLPSVTVQMYVLQPAVSTAHAMAAHWKRVDLLADHNSPDAAADCELISQIKLNLLSLFTARNVDYRATCSHGQMQPGVARLKADVLLADSGPAAGPATASR